MSAPILLAAVSLLPLVLGQDCAAVSATAAANLELLNSLKKAIQIVKIVVPILAVALLLALIVVIFLLVKGLKKIKNKLPLPEEYQGFMGFFRFIRALPQLQISLGGKPPSGDIALQAGETDAQKKERQDRDKRYAQNEESKDEDAQRKKNTQKEQEDKVKRAQEEYVKKGQKTVKNSDIQNQTLVKRNVTHSTIQGRHQSQGQQPQDVVFKRYPYPETTHRNEEQQKEDIREFMEEDERRRRVKHQNVAEYVGFVSEMPNFGFVSKYYSRGSLRDALFGQRKLDLTAKQIAKFALETSQAVKAYHEADQVVKTVASRNVLLDGDERNTVARLDPTFEPSSTDSKNGQQKEYVGSVSWLAPEAMETKEYTKQSDVFSFGVYLWELFARADPFENKTTIEVACPVIHKNLRLQPPANTPEAIKNLITACFHADPAQRPSIQDVERTLTTYYQSL